MYAARDANAMVSQSPHAPPNWLNCSCRAARSDMTFWEEHHKEEQAKSRREMEARELLFRSVVNNEPLQSPALREELSQLQDWWQRSVRELQSPGSDPALQHEAQFASEWCISLADVIVEEERVGTLAKSLQRERTREWVWRRFGNLDSGLMSNGLPQS